MTTHPANIGPNHAWTGSRYIDVTDPKPEDIILSEIATGLSREQRFRGSATSIMWSVGQHVLLTLHLMEEDGITDPDLLRAGFMHDATEYVLGDLIRAVKRNTPAFRAMETAWWGAISARFDLPRELPAEVHRYDRLALAVEKRCLISERAGAWPGLPDARGRTIPATLLRLNPDETKHLFLETAAALGVEPATRTPERAHFRLNREPESAMNALGGAEGGFAA